ncbi:hypothetical protein I601_1720 [Nocardioides dokdonensis FR1436]|uniref:DUF3618 domain-containing protein n=1 Tax=Nocardioides dokdonensis FR1436 TaxID=1300347 RepID=A0A1A9GL08_9ACTN|nr:DUF3618 domain-containing protein [Nocardioides dokdonensis]ANH38151.1 hypothetical protein I601_1720 [Nocardioides dokdonensis FR1436]
MADPQDKQTPEQIEAEIERTRERLGETIEALGAKADVKGRAAHRARSVREQHGTALVAGAAGAVVLAVGLVLWRRRR